MTRTVVGARFQTAGRMYFFEPGPVDELALNEWVIVQTELGQDAARVQILPTDSPLVQVDPPLGTLVRKATASDKFELAKHKRREAESAQAAAEVSRRLCFASSNLSVAVAFRRTVPSGGSTCTSGESVGRICTRAAS